MTVPLSTRTRSRSVVPGDRKPSPQTYVHTGVINSQRKGSLRPSERAESRSRTKKHLVALAKEIHEPELAQKLADCHSRVAVLSCGRHASRPIPTHTCEFRLCPYCARRRAWKHFRNYLPKVMSYLRVRRSTPVLITLTQAHRSETLESSVKRLTTAFQKLVRRRFWKDHFRGGIWAAEVTKGRDEMYHTHLHLLAFRTEFFDISLLRSEWLAVTGDSLNLNLKPILEDVESGLREVLKYIAKPLDIERFDGRNLRDFLGVKNMRFFGTFGDFRKFCADFEPSDNDDELTGELAGLTRDLVEGCACPYPGCGDPLFEVRLSEKEYPDFLRRVEASARSGSPPGRIKTS